MNAKRALVSGLAALLGAQTALAAGAPDDPFFHQQWALANDGTQIVWIDADDLHTVPQRGTAGVDIGWLAALDKINGLATNPVTVAVIDSGIDLKQPDLQGRIRSDGWDFLGNSGNLSDDMGHGTHVSGIIAANAGNAKGIAGVAPATVSILPLRILSKTFTGFAYNNKLLSDYAADAINYAVAHGAAVINMSLGWPKFVDTANARAAVANAIRKGVLIVAAAGNDRKDLPTYPCAYEGVLCVGSITNTGALAAYSNMGGMVDLLAPGDSIVSTYPSGVESAVLRIQGYEMLSGTSQASPQVAAIAAALRSANPGIGLGELKARLLSSAGALPSDAAALYGLVNYRRAIDAQPRPVFLPDFKAIEEIPVDEPSLKIQGTLSLGVLWAPASGVTAKVELGGTVAGQAQAASIAAGGSLQIPWSYTFASLDDSSDLSLTLSVSAAGQAAQTFKFRLEATRAMQNLARAHEIDLPDESSWIGNINGHLFSRINGVNPAPGETGAPRFYQVIGTGQLGLQLQLFDPQAQSMVSTVNIPGIQKVSQVMRLDVTGSGRPGWIVTGPVNADGKPFFQFYFLDADLKPLWGTMEASTWQVSLITPLAQSIIRNYAAAASWLRGADGRLDPCFIAGGSLPDGDNFDELDPRHYRGDTHLYYLEPQPMAAGAKAVTLRLRALDNSAFRTRNPGLHLRASVSSNGQGHVRVLLGSGDGLDARTQLWDVRSTTDTSLTPAPGWDSLSSSGQALIALTPDVSKSQPVFLSFYDATRGNIAWSDDDGKFQDSTGFTYSSPENPIQSLIGSYNLPGFGRFWFLETSWDLVGFHQGVGPLPAAAESQRIPIERDSSISGQQFSEMFTAVVVGTDARPLPGVYIDSTLVRGNRVSIAVWDTQKSQLLKPLRYSLQVPDGCVEMGPARLSAAVESFALPLLCGPGAQGGGMKLLLAQPN